MVIEVGITDVRYVTLEHGRPWVIHAYRNIKGRGLHKEEELESESLPLASVGATVTSDADDSVGKASTDDVIEIETLTAEQGDGLDGPLPIIQPDFRMEGDVPSNDDSKKRKFDEIEDDSDNINAVKETLGDDITSTSDAKKFKSDKDMDDTQDSTEPVTSVVLEEVDEQESSQAADATADNPGGDNQLDERSELKTRSVRKRKSSCGESQPASKCPMPTSTYDKVRLIIQPWRKPEGGVNKPILKMMLESVMLFLMMKPGSTEKVLLNRYLPYLQPMVLRNIVQILEEIGCVKKKFIKKSKCSLFSKPASPELSAVGTEDHDVMFIPTEECLFRLGQFGREFFGNATWPSRTT